MKILLTGSTSSHISSTKHSNSPTFVGQLNKALTYAGHEVVWSEPSVEMDQEYIKSFDSVVVGMAPLNSTAAHRIYGALSVIHYASEAGTLKLLVDAPEPKRVWAGIRAVHNKPEELIKDFYSKRKEYKKTRDEKVFSRLREAVEFLYENQWPTTVFPVFPWMGFPSLSTDIPQTNITNVVELNFDSDLLSEDLYFDSEKQDYWVSDYPNSLWTKGIEKTISHEVVPISKSKMESSEQFIERIYNSIGCLVSLHKRNNPWWSVALSQALNCRTPVVTDWRLSQALGRAWSVLPQSIEEMNAEEREELAIAQKEIYLNTVPAWDTSVELACSALLGRKE